MTAGKDPAECAESASPAPTLIGATTPGHPPLPREAFRSGRARDTERVRRQLPASWLHHRRRSERGLDCPPEGGVSPDRVAQRFQRNPGVHGHGECRQRFASRWSRAGCADEDASVIVDDEFDETLAARLVDKATTTFRDAGRTRPHVDPGLARLLFGLSLIH